LGLHFFGEDLWEWLTLWPKMGPFWQISHTLGMFFSLWFVFYTIKTDPAQPFFPDFEKPPERGGRGKP
jgi:hypothetical protein